MFRFNRTIVRPNTRHSIGTFSECIHYALTERTNTASCIWPYDDSNEPKHVAEFLTSITNIHCVND